MRISFFIIIAKLLQICYYLNKVSMEKLKVESINEHNVYTFSYLEKNAKIDLMFELYGLNKSFSLQKDDIIYINEKLLNKNSSNYIEPYSFEVTKDYLPKNVVFLNMENCIVLKRKNKMLVLKRIYG